MKLLILLITVFYLQIANCQTVVSGSVAMRGAAALQGSPITGGGGGGSPDILWWKGNTGSGTTDTATVGPNCTLQSSDMWKTTFTPGGSSSDLFFDQFRYANSASTITFSTNKITVEFRIYATNYSSTTSGRYIECNLSAAKNCFGIGNLTDAGGGTFLIRVYDNGFNISDYTFARPTTSTWHHIAVVINNSAASAPLAYVDGSSVTVTLSTESRASFASFDVGTVYYETSASGGGDGWNWTPYLKDLRIYSGLRSASDILADATDYP